MTTLDVQWTPGRDPSSAASLPVPGGQFLEPQVIDATFVDEDGELTVGDDRPDPEDDARPVPPVGPPPGAGNTTTMLVLGGLAIGGIYLLTRRRR